MKGELSDIISKISVQWEKMNIFQQFSPFWAYVKFSSVVRTQKGLYQIFSNLSFCNKWICWWRNPLKHLLEQTFSPVASSGHPWGSKYTRLTLYLGTESKKLDINTIYGLIELSWWLQKGKTIVSRSYIIGH